MVRSGNYIVQATILEGRYFTKKQDAKLYIQCRFNHEILTTDPIDHTNTPFFDTELAWDVDSKTLSFLRSQRVSLKLICYTIDVTSRREPLGYIMLDLRAGSQGLPPFPEKWYPLINNKNVSSFRPEIKIAFSIVNKQELERATLEAIAKQQEKQKEPAPEMLAPPIETTTTNLSASASTNIAIKQLKLSIPIELKDDGFYQVGNGQDNFVLSITIAFAEYLLALVEQPLEPQSEGEENYYFCYTFLGTDVATHHFSDLGQPNFPAERITIRFRSTKSDLLQLLSEIGKLTIRLIHKHKVIGISGVNLNSLVEIAEEENLPVIEKVYNLFTPKEELPLSVDGQPASIGVSLSLSHEISQNLPTESIKDNRSEKIGVQSADQNITSTKTTHIGGANPVSTKGTHMDLPNKGSVSPEVKQSSSFGALSQNAKQSSPSKHTTEITPRTEDNSPAFPHNSFAPPQQNRPVTPSTTSFPVKWNQFRFSVDLRSVRDITIKSANIYFRYFYTPFGSNAPVITHPALNITRTQQEIILPPSFCAFEFVMNPNRLRTYLEAVPLVLEMWHRDSSTQNVLLGTASVDLSQVIAATRVTGPSSEKGPIIQSIDQFVTVLPSDATSSAHSRIADVRVILALEDFGHVQTSLEQNHQSSTLESIFTHSSHQERTGFSSSPRMPSQIPQNVDPNLPGGMKNRNSPQRQQIPFEHEPSIHDTDEYRAALDLELWRQEEEARFKQYLIDREMELTAKWADEWKVREKEREELLKSKLESFKKFETRLQTLAFDLEKREKILMKGEMEFEQRQRALEREATRQIDEARDASRRLQDEFKHRIEIEKQKTSELELQKQKALRERDQWETKFRSLDEEFTTFRKKMSQSQEAELRVQLAKSIEEKNQLEKEILDITVAKKRYKTELRRALDEISKLKRQKQSGALATGDDADEQKKKLDEFKWQVLAKEQLDAIKIEKSALDVVKEDLAALREAAGLTNGRVSAPLFASNHSKNDLQHPFSASLGVAGNTGSGQFDKHRAFEVERLSKEKESLLESGVYVKDDRLIRELDCRIQEMLKF